MKYDRIIIDTVNLAYKVFNHKDEKAELIRSKAVYKESVCKFIDTVNNLKDRYLHFDGEVNLLVDNYFSRADLQSSFMYADRRELSEAYKYTRKKESKEFYNSINLIRYYYMIGPSSYTVSRIDGLEADDLISPLLKTIPSNQKCLLVTSDLDWTRYLNANIDWLPKLGEEPQDFKSLELELGFPITRESIIMYKSIFGDKSDNITGITSANTKHMEEFKYMLSQAKDPLDVVALARKNSKFDSNLLGIIFENERQYIVNVQLTSEIPCDISYFEENTQRGRNDETMYKILREILGLEIQKRTFQFGNVKRPRVAGN